MKEMLYYRHVILTSMKRHAVWIAVACFLLAGCAETHPGNDTGDLASQLGKQDQPATASADSSHTNATPMFEKAPDLTIDPKKHYQATLATQAGDITVELFADKTPHTVNNFVFLAGQHFYDNTFFHRAIKGFMIQGGDPTGTGTGGPGYSFPDEPFEGAYTRGTLAMANAGPDTNGSQFFIVQEDTPLPKNYVIFGKVVSGMEAVDKIANAPVKAGDSGEQSTPIDPVHITSVTISESAQ